MLRRLKISEKATNIIHNDSFKVMTVHLRCKCNLVSLWSSSCFSPAQQTEFSALWGKFKRYHQKCVAEVSFFLIRNSILFIIYIRKDRPLGAMTRFTFLSTFITITIRKNALLLTFFVICLLVCMIPSFFICYL